MIEAIVLQAMLLLEVGLVVPFLRRRLGGEKGGQVGGAHLAQPAAL
jgi:hypothetical protein